MLFYPDNMKIKNTKDEYFFLKILFLEYEELKIWEDKRYTGMIYSII